MLDDTEYDTIVTGTGFVESVVAAALARGGQKVLHLEENPFYGAQQTSTLSWQEFQEYVGNNGVLNTEERRLGKLRDYNIDMLPTPIMSSGPLVDVLVKSNVGRYLEFKPVDNCYMYMPWNKKEKLQLVPASRQEVFKTTALSLRQKSDLMGFTKKCMQFIESEPEDSTETEDTEKENNFPEKKPETDFAKQVRDEDSSSFSGFLQKHRITGDLQTFVLHALVLHPFSLSDTENQLTTAEGMAALTMYMNGVGKYGHSSYLYPLYGFSEINQAFCRVCAVYQGIYVLRRSVQAITVKGKNQIEVVSGDQTLTCKNLITNHFTVDLQENIPSQFSDLKSQEQTPILRCVVVADQFLLKGREDEEAVLANCEINQTGTYSACVAMVPPDVFGNEQCIQVVQLTHGTKALPEPTVGDHGCPKCLIHFTTRSTNKEVLCNCVNELINLTGPPKTTETTITENQNASPEESSSENPSSVPTTQDAPSSTTTMRTDPRPAALYYCFFDLCKRSTSPVKVAADDDECKQSTDKLREHGVWVVPGVSTNWKMSSEMKLSEHIHKVLNPDEPFLSKLPNPQDASLASGVVRFDDLESQLLGVDNIKMDAPEGEEGQKQEPAAGSEGKEAEVNQAGEGQEKQEGEQEAQQEDEKVQSTE